MSPELMGKAKVTFRKFWSSLSGLSSASANRSGRPVYTFQSCVSYLMSLLMCLRRNVVNGRLLVSMPSSKHAPGLAHAKRLLSIAYSASNRCLNLLMASTLEAAIRWRALEAPIGMV